MRRKSVLLALACTVPLVLACRESPTTSLDESFDPAFGQDGATQFWEPIVLSDWDLCGYDVVDFEGTAHVVWYPTRQDASGGWHSRYHETWKLTGVGQTTGEVWKWNEHYDWSSNWAEFLPGQDEATQLWHVNLVGDGQTPDFKIHFIMHYSVNANGDLVSQKYTYSECE